MLKRVSIQNFKSLKDVTLDLQKVNLLIGPNNSGKTNFLKALELFDWVLEKNSLPDTVSSLGYKHDPLLKIYVHAINEQTEQQKEDGKFLHLAIEINNNEGNAHKWTNSSPDYLSYRDTALLLKDTFKQVAGYIKIYKPDPNKLAKPGPVGYGAATVNADASNIIGFLDLMLGNYRRTAFSQIESALSICVPEFNEVNLEDFSPTGELIRDSEELLKTYGKEKSGYSFKRLGLTNSKQNVKYWSDELSEGTLYFLALLCIVNQPNPPKLLLLEEPEKGIHPRRIYEVIQFIFKLAEDKDIQVIMTTHSPIVLDMFKDMPESVFIFDKDDEGATYVKNLQRDVIEPDTERSKEYGLEPPHYTDALGDSWTIGFLGGVPK